MSRYELFLLGGSYRHHPDGDSVVVELFGRTKDGRSVTARCYDHRPWFMLVEPDPAVREALSHDPEVLKLEDLKVFYRGAERDTLRVTIKFPWKVPDYRRRFAKPGEDEGVLACDIPFAHRFLYDRDLGLTVAFDAEPEPEAARRGYTTQEVVRVQGAISPCDTFRPPLTYLSFDIENSLKDRTIFCLCGVVQRGDGELRGFRLQGAERGILEGFFAKVQEEDPDIIVGYNIGGYDIPLLEERAKALGLPDNGALPLGRDLGPVSDIGDRLWRAHGRAIADAWWFARTILHPKQETLEFVSRLLLGEGKKDVDRRNMDEEWAKDPAKVVEYCEHDAVLALRILRKLRAVERGSDMATVAHLYLEEGLNGRTSLLVDSLLIPEADRRRIGVPPTRRTAGDAAIEGGYVHAIKPDLVKWVVVLDFKSMYPSIIISKNICFTTLSPQGSVVAPNGARFLSPDVRRGLVPDILRSLMAERDRLKRELKATKGDDERLYLDGLQNAVKILMNSFYGVLASSFYRFTNKEIGAAITAFARETTKSVIAAVEAEGAEVIYSDTDSIFVRSPQPSLEGARALGEKLSATFSKEGTSLEFQSVYASFFSHGVKKRYVARQVWPKEDTIIRGYETRRTDSFDLQSQSLQEVFELVLSGETEKACEHAREVVQNVLQGKYEAERYIIARTVRGEEQYNAATRDALPFLRIFRQLKEEGYPVVPGMKVAWIVTNAKKSPQQVEPYVEGRELQGRPDVQYYAERVAQTLARVTEVFGWDQARLLQRTQQQNLFGGEVASARPPVEAGIAVGGGTSALEALETGRRKKRQASLGEF
ncbi:MAG: DNA polymerase II [Euryarchaeota archaeon]|nr:DNA polymerase II [Euryarchaeota archaeon]MDE2044039.1 DNA polymerase II [Thermoplasmata archaeon]